VASIHSGARAVTRRRKPETRPIFALLLRPEPGTDSIRNLRLALKFLLRRFRLRAVSCVETRDNGAP
jgi:hypothetical protein